MMSLFSSFDLNFFLVTMFPMFMSYLFLSPYVKIFSFKITNDKILNFFEKFFYSVKPKLLSSTLLVLVESILIYLFLVNFFSVFSFNFPLTSQVSVVLFLALLFWFTYTMFSILNNMKSFLAHCVPEGCPMGLVFLLFIIELTSYIIRPLTLTIRLTANILAGHLLLILLSKLVLSKFLFLGPYATLNMVEMMVAMIQAYIFVTMVCLYYSEIN